MGPTIAFDPSYTGESGGMPRYVVSPDINTEDFSAAVDFLATNDMVDSERIGIIGICGWGGLAIRAAAADPRIKDNNKLFMVIPGASHTDLYDRLDIIPFDHITSFFNEYLK